jgi:hypothetical protein
VTDLQKTVFLAVIRAMRAGHWYRAARNGERVTLASLYRAGVLIRRPHRGVEGAADAAYEYNVSPEALAALKEAVQ